MTKMWFVATLGKGKLNLAKFVSKEEAQQEGKQRLKTRTHKEAILVFYGEETEA